jgi:uncharacterized protein YndB with AHSA1/START domain
MTKEKIATEAIVVERIYNASSDKVWQALTDTAKMKEWYFDIKAFKAEVGFEFSFYADDGKGRKLLHLCKITAVVPGRKLAYTWKYDYDPNVTVVTFELFPEGDKTKVKLTHEGVDNFSAQHPELARNNFVQGWTDIVGQNLKAYVEKQ